MGYFKSIKIGKTSYNVDVLSKLSFEEFKKVIPKNSVFLYEKITGKKAKKSTKKDD